MVTVRRILVPAASLIRESFPASSLAPDGFNFTVMACVPAMKRRLALAPWVDWGVSPWSVTHTWASPSFTTNSKWYISAMRSKPPWSPLMVARYSLLCASAAVGRPNADSSHRQAIQRLAVSIVFAIVFLIFMLVFLFFYNLSIVYPVGGFAADGDNETFRYTEVLRENFMPSQLSGTTTWSCMPPGTAIRASILSVSTFRITKPDCPPWLPMYTVVMYLPSTEQSQVWGSGPVSHFAVTFQVLVSTLQM